MITKSLVLAGFVVSFLGAKLSFAQRVEDTSFLPTVSIRVSCEVGDGFSGSTSKSYKTRFTEATCQTLKAPAYSTDFAVVATCKGSELSNQVVQEKSRDPRGSNVTEERLRVCPGFKAIPDTAACESKAAEIVRDYLGSKGSNLDLTNSKIRGTFWGRDRSWNVRIAVSAELPVHSAVPRDLERFLSGTELQFYIILDQDTCALKGMCAARTDLSEKDFSTGCFEK